MKKMGRPKGDNNKEHVCSIRIDDDTYNRLVAYCEFFSVPKSEAFREAIDLLIEEKKKDIAE